MAYLSFRDYMMMGGTIEDQDVFSRLSVQAEQLITRMTHGRIIDETPVRPCVQYAAYAILEAAYKDEQANSDGREIASVSNDGVSVSYVTESGSANMHRSKRYAGIVKTYLEWETDAHGTPLLYVGVDA